VFYPLSGTWRGNTRLEAAGVQETQSGGKTGSRQLREAAERPEAGRPHNPAHDTERFDIPAQVKGKASCKS